MDRADSEDVSLCSVDRKGDKFIGNKQTKNTDTQFFMPAPNRTGH